VLRAQQLRTQQHRARLLRTQLPAAAGLTAAAVDIKVVAAVDMKAVIKL
jgi:hypothetical protein